MLFPHQKQSIKLMQEREESFMIKADVHVTRTKPFKYTIDSEKNNRIYFTVHTNIGLLSNSAGTGKTFIILDLIRQNPLIKTLYKQDLYMNKILIENLPLNIPKDIVSIIAEYSTSFACQALTFSHDKNPYKDILRKTSLNESFKTDIQIDSNLIIVTHFVFHQWKKMLEEFYPTLKVYYINRYKDIPLVHLLKQEDIQNHSYQIGKKYQEIFSKYDIVLCNCYQLKLLFGIQWVKVETYSTLRLQQIDNLIWNRLIIDEPQQVSEITKLSIPNIKSHFLWLISHQFNTPRPSIKDLLYSNQCYNSTILFQIFYKLSREFSYKTFKKLCIKVEPKLKEMEFTTNSKFVCLPNHLYYCFFKMAPLFRTQSLYDFFFFMQLNIDAVQNSKDIIFGQIIADNHQLNISTDINEFSLSKYIWSSSSEGKLKWKHAYTFKTNPSWQNNLILLHLVIVQGLFDNCYSKFSNISSIEEYTSCESNESEIISIFSEFLCLEKTIFANSFCIFCFNDFYESKIEQNYACLACRKKYNIQMFSIYPFIKLTRQLLLKLKQFKVSSNYTYKFNDLLDKYHESYHSNAYDYCSPKSKSKILNSLNFFKFDEYQNERALKCNVIRSILNERKNEKSIICVNNTTIENITALIREQGLKYGILGKNSATINRRITDYINGDMNILIINMNTLFRPGLNLQETDNIFVIGNTSDAYINSLKSKVNRLGKNINKELNIIYITYANEQKSMRINQRTSKKKIY